MDYHLLQSLPTNPGVYLFKDLENKVIYVGKAKNIKKRVASYFTNKSLESKTIRLLKNADHIDHIVVGSEIEAFLLEANLIKKYKPYYNIKLLDDKSYPYIKISNEKAPSVLISRNKNDENAVYFGPYPNVNSLRIVLKLLRKIFPFQAVKNHPKGTCLYYHLHLCPCINSHPENLYEYNKTIKNIKSFLDGKKEKLVADLKKEQKTYIKKEEFEVAKEIQDKINAINLITSDFYDPFSYEEKPDFYYERIKNELASLKNILTDNGASINSLNRIECYDISNLQGKNATASMVVFIKGDAQKNEYKKFKIKTKNTPDDFYMLKEVITRRLAHTNWQIPDLIVIDGGKGQVSSVLSVLIKNENKIPVIGLAKREETIILPKIDLAYELTFDEIHLPQSNPGINLLKRLRDEAHRFAITYHRLLRKKAFLA